MTRTLVFDTETTGLLPKKTAELNECPHIIQLSFIVYNNETEQIEITYNSYVNVETQISEIITKITGITQEMCKNGIPITTALNDFYNAYLKCDIIVGHNIQFDISMISLSIRRNIEYLSGDICSMFDKTSNNKTYYCTMRNCIDDCNIIREANRKNGTTYKYKKFPKLEEAHNHYFHTIPTGLHNALVDTLVCLRIYLKQKYEKHVDDNEFTQWLYPMAITTGFNMIS